MIGRGRIFLPRDFKGLLAVKTKNGPCTLSADLSKHAVRVPNRFKEKLEGNELYERCSSSKCLVNKVPRELGNGVDVWYEINGGGLSMVNFDTKNGAVFAGFVQDYDVLWDDADRYGEVGCCTKCSIM